MKATIIKRTITLTSNSSKTKYRPIAVVHYYNDLIETLQRLSLRYEKVWKIRYPGGVFENNLTSLHMESENKCKIIDIYF